MRAKAAAEREPGLAISLMRPLHPRELPTPIETPSRSLVPIPKMASSEGETARSVFTRLGRGEGVAKM